MIRVRIGRVVPRQQERRRRRRRRIQQRKTNFSVPPNDEYNFFYAQYQDGGGKYETPRYPRNSNLDYPRYKARAVVSEINEKYVFSNFCKCFVFWISAIPILSTLTGDFLVFVIVTWVVILTALMFTRCYKKYLFKELKKFLDEVNEDYKDDDDPIFWEVSENGGYLHLCTHYPEHYNGKGAWIMIDQAWQTVVQNAILKVIQPDIKPQQNQDIFQSQRQLLSSQNEELCPICLQNLFGPEEEEACQTNCFHKFHRSCIWRWNQKEKTCPVCRQPVTDYYEYSPDFGFAVKSADELLKDEQIKCAKAKSINSQKIEVQSKNQTSEVEMQNQQQPQNQVISPEREIQSQEQPQVEVNSQPVIQDQNLIEES